MPATVELTGVEKWFASVHAVAATDLRVESGEFLTLLGPSGCGKTTLLRLIAGLIHPDRGSLTIDGRPPEQAKGAKQIGFVPQSPALLPWRTVRANAQLLRGLNRSSNNTAPGDATTGDTTSTTPPSRPDIGELLEEVGLADFTDAYPHELSGGMQQRVALVRAFALGSPLLLMDEPFAALDEMTRTDMRHLLVRLRSISGATVVFVTHSIEEAAFLSDRVAVMSPRPGRITHLAPIDLARPRDPDLEDTTSFFEVVTTLRSALRSSGNAT